MTSEDSSAAARDDHDLLKPPRRQPSDRALRLDDASDRVAVLAGRVIGDLERDPEGLDTEDISQLRDAVIEVEQVLDEIVEEQREELDEAEADEFFGTPVSSATLVTDESEDDDE